MVVITSSSALDRFIARQNIEHYRQLLAKETDEGKRQQLLRLLAEEEIKLRAAEQRPKKERR